MYFGVIFTFSVALFAISIWNNHGSNHSFNPRWSESLVESDLNGPETIKDISSTIVCTILNCRTNCMMNPLGNHSEVFSASSWKSVLLLEERHEKFSTLKWNHRASSSIFLYVRIPKYTYLFCPPPKFRRNVLYKHHADTTFATCFFSVLFF